MNIVHIVGNRPQFIKLSLLHEALSIRPGVHSRVIHTGQHFSDNMSGAIFRDCGLPVPDLHLDIHSLPHNQMIGRMLIALDAALAADRPDAVVVYGDTNTTLAGSLAAKKRSIPLMHVEAGIRTGDDLMPEEANRYLSDRMAELNFTCTTRCTANLLNEGIPGTRIIESGDLLLDAVLQFAERANSGSTLPSDLVPEGKPFILATVHRSGNTEDPRALVAILKSLQELHKECPVIFPIHPRTRAAMDANGLSADVTIIPPVGYFDMLALLQSCSYVITDSGGLAREAFFFSKPSVIVSDHPFWPEIPENGPSLVSPADREMLISRFRAVQTSGRPFIGQVFGDGHAAEKIAAGVINYLHG